MKCILIIFSYILFYDIKFHSNFILLITFCGMWFFFLCIFSFNRDRYSRRAGKKDYSFADISHVWCQTKSPHAAAIFFLFNFICGYAWRTTFARVKAFVCLFFFLFNFTWWVYSFCTFIIHIVRVVEIFPSAAKTIYICASHDFALYVRNWSKV